MPSFLRISASQLDSWHSLYQSAKEMLKRSLIIEDVHKMVSLEPHSQTQNWEKGWQRNLPIADIYIRWNRVHRFEPETKRQSMEWHNPQSPWKKTFKKFCVSRQGHDHCICGLQDDSCRRHAVRGDNSYACIRTLTKLGRCFKWVLPHNPPKILLQHDSVYYWHLMITYLWDRCFCNNQHQSGFPPPQHPLGRERDFIA
jgi:hypothetical protein